MNSYTSISTLSELWTRTDRKSEDVGEAKQEAVCQSHMRSLQCTLRTPVEVALYNPNTMKILIAPFLQRTKRSMAQTFSHIKIKYEPKDNVRAISLEKCTAIDTL